jgi:hypothetical protein
MEKLTEKQKRFVRAYKTNGNNATKAAVTAGYSKKTAYSQGQRLLKNVEIKKALGLEDEKLQKKYEYTLEKLIEELEIAQKSAIELGNLTAYLKAIELKGKAFGLFTDTVRGNIELTQALVRYVPTKKETEKQNDETS